MSPSVPSVPSVPDPADPATAFATGAFQAHFAELPDPRVARGRHHHLLDIVTVAVCAVVRGADTWVDVAAFGQAKEAWLRTFLPLPGGIPSHDTFGRVFAALDPAAFEAAFVGRVQALVATAPTVEPVTGAAGASGVPGPVVAIDGKTVRRSHDRARGRGPPHLVSAWAEGSGLVLGQVAVGAKTNETVAIPALLDPLDPRSLARSTVTIDVMGCQRDIAGDVVGRGADDVLALQANQGERHELVAHHVAGLGGPTGDGTAAPHVTVGKDHGRIETRACRATGDPAVLRWLDPDGLWPGLRSLARVEGERRLVAAGSGAVSATATVTRDRRYYLSSLAADPARIAAAVRGHRGIENRLHWVLDVAFRADDCRVRSGHAAENLAVQRHLALHLLRRETTAKVGIKAKRLTCGWDVAYLLTVLARWECDCPG